MHTDGTPGTRQGSGGESSPLAPAPRLLRFAGGLDHAPKEIEPRIAQMNREMDEARKQGVWGLMRLRWEAWLEERMKGPAIAKMRTRQEVLMEQHKTAQAEILLQNTVQTGEVGAQRHQIAWNEVNRLRLASELQSLGLMTAPAGAAALSSSTLAEPPLAPHVTDAQVEAVALRALMQGVETMDEWDAYKEELGKHLPPLAVEEVGQRLRALLHSAGRECAF